MMDGLMVRQNGTGRSVDLAGEGLSKGEEWREALPAWLSYLVAAFPQARVDMMTYAVLEDVFQGYAPEVMKAAARAYVARHQFWPTAAELRPFVEWAEARPDGRGREAIDPPTVEELHRMRMAQVRARIQYSDEEMLAWEAARGMSLVADGDEPVEDAGTEARVREAQEKMAVKGWGRPGRQEGERRMGPEGEAHVASRPRAVGDDASIGQ
jgi:hypothetical protein